MKLNDYESAKTYTRPVAMSLLATIACALVMLAPGMGTLAFTHPAKAVASNPEMIHAQPPSQLPKKPLKCIDVSRRWQLCGSGSKTHLTAGVGIRFNEIDPNGKIVASRSYDDCDKLAGDKTLSADVRAEAARQCRQSFHPATEASHKLGSPLPDLQIKKFLSTPAAPQKLKVYVTNAGKLGSAPCVLRLTVRKINGTSVGRVTEIKVPALAAGKGEWVFIDAASILPKSVALNDTTFRLDIDPEDAIDEINEKNNQVWYNL